MPPPPPAPLLEDDGRLLLFSTSKTWPGPYHNGAIRLDRSLHPAEVLARAQAFFADRPGYCVWIAAHADADLERDAAGEPATPRSRPRARPAWPSTTASTPASVPPGVTLDEVTDDEGRLDYLAVTVEAYADSFLPRDAAEAQLATRARRVRARGARRRGAGRGATRGGRHGRGERHRGRHPAGGHDPRRPGARLRGAVHALGGRCGIRARSRRHRPRGVGGGRAAVPAPGVRGGVALPLVLRPAVGVEASTARRGRG